MIYRSGEAMLELSRRSDVVKQSLADTIGCILLARFDSSPAVRKIWNQVFEEGTSAVMSATLRLYWPEILSTVVSALSGSVWRLRLSAAKVLVDVSVF